MKRRFKCYEELIFLPTFEERFEYLRLNGKVGFETFGYDRIFNQLFYSSKEWRNIRDYVIARDLACDLGVEGFDIMDASRIRIHHMIPIEKSDIDNRNEILLDPRFLITTTFETHSAIHYGDSAFLRSKTVVERFPNDICPWRKR